jgi:hypothetical protein
MKRDLDLLREIMLVLEDKMEYGKNFQSNQLIEVIQDKTLNMHKLAYHVGLLVESNLIRAKENKYYGGEPTDYLINTITSQGHDFIDTIRQDTTWNKIKAKASDIGGFSLSILMDIGKELLNNKIVGQF